MQKTLPLTDSNSFEYFLENDFSGLNLNVFVRPRLEKSWRIERKRDKYSLIIPQIFVYAPDDIKISLLKWSQILVSNKFSKKKAAASIKKQIKDLESKIYGFLKAEIGGDTLKRRTFRYPYIKFANTQGEKYDLREVFDEINKEHFGSGMPEVFLRWGREKGRTSYHAICNDHNRKPFHLITIAGVYNTKRIPRFAIEAVMYHEMLHIAFPPIEVGTKRNIHHKKFCEMEREFPHYNKWKIWQNKR